MRILLTSNASYAPPRGGSTRSNLVWLRHLAAAGHACRVLALAFDGVAKVTSDEGVEIHSVAELTRHPALLAGQIREFQPDWVLVSSEDLSHVLLREAGAAAGDRIVYLAHTPQFFPFGPESWNPDPKATAVVRQARAVVAIGNHMAGYIREHAGVEARMVHPPIYGTAPWPQFGRFGDGPILMINPCRVKGVGIFAALAERFPEMRFEALAGWGTTAGDRALLGRYPNVRVLESVPNIDEVLGRAQLLLMPSLWYEGFGLIAMEAMLRGLPVIASNSGGLMEAKRGTSFVVPVAPIQSYTAEFDETHMPVPVERMQAIEPWAQALETLTGNHAAYDEESRRSRARAVEFVSRLRAADFEDLLTSLRPEPMRVLLAHNSLYYPSHGGGDKSNRLLAEALAARGHSVRVVARIERFGREEEAAFLRKVEDLAPVVVDGVARFTLRGVDVLTVTSNPKLRAVFAAEVAAFDPDVILTSTDDPAQLLLGAALEAPRAHVVHLVRATIAVPFGPDASAVNAARAANLRRVDAVVGVSEYVARYVHNFGGMDATHVPISLMDSREWEPVAQFTNPYVTFTNPCAVKGIDLFLDVARAMPEIEFAAVPTWGTNQADLARLRAAPNVRILEPVENMADLFRQTRVLLVPSVWAEARSRVVMEAMLAGVPVVASDVGGIPEAKLGVPYLIPINPIRSYRAAVDENMVPVAEVPEQNPEPWIVALRRLTTDEAHWSGISRASREAALGYARSSTVEPFEKLLGRVLRAPKRAEKPLSDDRRKLLALRLRRKSAPQSIWFPVIASEGLRVFALPHAGGGTLMSRSWRAEIPGIVPVCLPGREHRLAEPPIEEMQPLVRALGAAIEPYLDRPYALFGHSMGAAIAFELTREIARRGLPPPRALIVAAARPPLFREQWMAPTDPSDEDFLNELRRLEGIPRELLASPDALRVLMPALKADARLYRRYVYEPGSLLDMPVFAYAGTRDPNLPLAHLDRWREHTRASFVLREFDAGHFFPRDQREAFLRALAADLTLL